MSILTPTVRPVNRVFGEGIFPASPSHPARRGPSAVDLAYKLGFDLGLEFERPMGAPSHYYPAERDAFDQGQAEASAEIDARDAARALAHADDVAMSGLPSWHADALGVS